jgi:hypothetical protein
VFDFRYHALSLAAVLLALAVGVVIGVAIGDSDLVSSAKSGIVHDLKEEVAGAQHHAGELSTQLADEQAFVADLYPLAVHGLLSGEDVGLVFLGGSSNRINALARNAVTQAGASLATVVALREPPELEALAHAAEGTRFAALDGEASGAAGESGEAAGKLIESFGSIIGKQLVSGGRAVERELISRVRGRLLSAFDGQLGKLDGLIVARNEPASMTPEQSKATAALESGLIDGVAAVGIPIVGVELTSTEPSQVPWYQSHDISSVDNLDQTSGQAALIYALSGSHGSFGTKSTADSLLPNVVGASPQP